MKAKVGVLLITKNNEDTISKTLESIKDFASEIMVVDGGSVDKTIETVGYVLRFKSYKVLKGKFTEIGKQRQKGLKKMTSDWILILDSDEVLTDKLKQEIKKTLTNNSNKYSSFIIPFQNYYLGRRLRYGGENYKMERLFKRSSLTIEDSIIHNKFKINKGKIGKLKNFICHYSYRSISQIYRKFTYYAKVEAKIRYDNKEKVTLKKLFINPIHMFYSRFIKDKGYKDGFFRLPLDIGFAYMEFLTYFTLLFRPKKPPTPGVVFRPSMRR